MLKELLAGGGSFFGTNPGERYEVRKGAQLPVFGAVEKTDVAEAVKLDGELPAMAGSQHELDFEKAREARVKLAPERRAIQAEPEERRRLLDRRWRGGGRNKMTQAEMSLEQVQVVRNDLRDADLELAPRRARAAESNLNPFAPRPIAAIGRPTHEKIGFRARVARWFRFLKRSKG
jgi:hypothetical protein